ncbi:unnamed protein product [Closterium sp. NIES-64]|nr:unnamed protein product [Closterium sp. NIES-64]
MFCACCCAQCCESLGACCCAVCSLGTSRRVAKYIYGLLFLLALVLMWCLRDFGHTALMHLPSFKECKPGDQACTAATVVLCTGLGMSLFFAPMSQVTNIHFPTSTSLLPTGFKSCQPGDQACTAAMVVLCTGLGMSLFFALMSATTTGARACTAATVVLCTGLGMSLFFALMSATTTGARVDGGARDTWHSGWWPPKLLLWAALLGMTVFLPLGVLRIYGYVAVLGAVIFVVIQLVSMLNFVFVWNDTWQADKKWQVLAAVETGVCYLVVAATAALIYLFSMPSSCSLSLFFSSPPTPQARAGSGGNRMSNSPLLAFLFTLSRALLLPCSPSFLLNLTILLPRRCPPSPSSALTFPPLPRLP